MRIAGLAGQNADTDLPPSGNRKTVACWAWPKDWGAWTDRTGITTADFPIVESVPPAWNYVYPLAASSLTPVPLGDAGTILIAADSAQPGGTIQLGVVLWDLRAGVVTNPISVLTATITTGAVFRNAAGNFIGEWLNYVNCATASGFNIIVTSLSGTDTGAWNLHYRIF